MEKATPVQMRRSLEVVELLKKAGVHFMPMPVLNSSDYKNLSYHLTKRLETMAVEAEKIEKSHSQDCEMVKYGYSDCTCGADNQ